MKKREWEEFYTSGRFVGTDPAVIKFIADILYHDPREVGSEAINNLFSSGYCYYFALMLKDAFERGEICWHRGHGHIVWLDDTDIAYDIDGVFLDAGKEDLLPVNSSLKNMLVDFKHNSKTYHCEDLEFCEWAAELDLSDYEAVAYAYRVIPREEILDTMPVEEFVLHYWRTHKSELSEILTKDYIAEVRQKDFLFG